MRKSFAVPAQMFTHPPKLAWPTGRFEPPSMIEQHLEASLQRRDPRFGPFRERMTLQRESHLLFIPKKPGSSERSSPDQHTIDSGIAHATDNIVITVHIPIAE